MLTSWSEREGVSKRLQCGVDKGSCGVIGPDSRPSFASARLCDMQGAFISMSVFTHLFFCFCFCFRES